MAWFKMDVGSFLADTAGLSSSHVGIYARLLAMYWASGNRLPDNPGILNRKVGAVTPEEQAALAEVLEEFFPDRGDGVRFNLQLDDQLSAVKESSAQNSANAKQRYQPKPPGVESGADEDF